MLATYTLYGDWTSLGIWTRMHKCKKKYWIFGTDFDCSTRITGMVLEPEGEPRMKHGVVVVMVVGGDMNQLSY